MNNRCLSHRQLLGLIEIDEAGTVLYGSCGRIRLVFKPFCKRLSLEGAFICRRPVDRRHWNVVEPEVDAKLRAVMDIVIHYEAAQHGNLR